MPIIALRREDILLPNKLRLLEEIANLDVEAALPPTDTVPQDREVLLEELRLIDSELVALGVDARYEGTVWEAEAAWAAYDAREE